jgi:recombination protein RecR
MSLPASLQELVDQLKKLPVSAARAPSTGLPCASTPREDAERLCQAIRDVKDRVTYCTICNNITDSDPVRCG